PPSSPLSGNTVEITLKDQERWLTEVKGVASFEEMLKLQVTGVKMVMAVERADMGKLSEDKVNTFGRGDKRCIFNGNIITNVYRQIGDIIMVALQGSSLREKVNAQLSL